jgi:O-antigen/teichoic acid export membrane protein
LIGSDIHVGFYTTSRKITGLAVALIGSLGTVLIPRLSFYIYKKMDKEYAYLIQKSLNFIFLLAFTDIVLHT